MTKHMIVSPSSLLSSTATGLPLPGRENNAAKIKPAADWKIVFVGKKELPVMRFENIVPGKVLSNVVIELGFLSNDRLIGKLLLPHGLMPSDGVRLQIDNQPSIGKLPFQAFGRDGGIVSLDWNAATARSLRNGHALKIHARVASSRKSIVFVIPLDKFSTTSDWLEELIAQRRNA